MTCEVFGRDVLLHAAYFATQSDGWQAGIHADGSQAHSSNPVVTPSSQSVFVQNESERRPFVPLASRKPSHTVWAGHVVVVVPEAQA